MQEALRKSVGHKEGHFHAYLPLFIQGQELEPWQAGHLLSRSQLGQQRPQLHQECPNVMDVFLSPGQRKQLFRCLLLLSSHRLLPRQNPVSLQITSPPRTSNSPISSLRFDQ